MEPSDQEVIERALNGDIEAFGVLVQRYQGPVYRLLLRLCTSPHDAEDLSQEVFMEAYRSLPRLRDRRAFKAWLYRIAYNKARDLARSRQSGNRLLPWFESLYFMRPGSAWGESPKSDPEERVIEDDETERLSRVLNSIPIHYRAAIHLKYVEELTTQEIADTFGVSPRTIETRLYRGKQMLRERLEEVGLRA